MSAGKKKTRISSVRMTKTSWQQAVEQYLPWKKAEGRSGRTIKDYYYHITHFIKVYPDAAIDDYTSLKRAVIAYMAEDVKPAYYNNKLVYLKTFFTWCVNESILPDNPLKSFKRRKADSRIIDVKNKSLKELLSIPNQKTYTGLRDYALLLLQLDTGIRPKEALSLQVTEVNFRSLEIYIKAENAKTRIARTLPLSPITAKAIQKLINARPSEWDAEIPVFCTFDGRKWSVNGWYKQLSSHGNKIGIRVFPYQLRHTFALEFLRNGGNSFALQKTMGHADLNMTKRYVALADEDVKKQHTKPPRFLTLLSLKNGLLKSVNIARNDIELIQRGFNRPRFYYAFPSMKAVSIFRLKKQYPQ